jgi:hypothetical protein
MQMRSHCSIRILLILAFGLMPQSVLNAVPDRPRPYLPVREDRVDPVAAKTLRAGFKDTKWEAEIEQATFKFVAIPESGGSKAFAANDVSFSSGVKVYARIVGVAGWPSANPAKPATMVQTPQPALLIFDRPIRSLSDIAGAKLRQIEWLHGSSANFAAPP